MNKSKVLLKKIIITKKRNYKKILFVSLSTIVFIGGFGVGIGLPIAQAHKKTNEIKNTKIYIANDKSQFENFDQTLGNNPLPIQDGKINPEALEQLVNHKNLPKQIKDIKREYKITTNKETGVAKVTIALKGQHGHQDEATYHVKGFKTLGDIAVVKDLNLFKNFDQTLANKPHIISKDSISVQELESLDGHAQIPILTEKVTREFSLIVNENGQGTVNITFKAPNAKDLKTSYKLNGLKTNQEVEADKLVDDLNNLFSKKTEIVKDAFKTKTATQGLAEFNLNKFKNLANVDLTNIENINQATIIASVSKDNLHIEVNVSNATKENSITYKLTGFKTHAAALADEIVQNINRELVSSSSTVIDSKNSQSAVEAAATIIDAASFKEYTNKDLSTIPNIEKATLSATANINDVDVTINVPNATSNNPISYKIIGFKPLAKIALDKDLTRIRRSFKSSYDKKSISYIANEDKKSNGVITPKKLKAILIRYYGYDYSKWPKLTDSVSREYNIKTNSDGEATIKIKLEASIDEQTFNAEYQFKIRLYLNEIEHRILKGRKTLTSISGRIINP